MTTPSKTDQMLTRLDAILEQLETLGLSGPVVSPSVVNPDGAPGHVVAGELIESAWGNAVSNEFYRKRAWYAESTAVVGFNTTIADFPGLALSVTMDPTRFYKVSTYVPSIAPSGLSIRTVHLTNAANTTIAQNLVSQPHAEPHSLICSIVLTGLTGTQTFKVRMSTSSGSMSVNGDTNHRSYLLVEELSMS